MVDEEEEEEEEEKMMLMTNLNLLVDCVLIHL
jgi:hypothetical protein